MTVKRSGDFNVLSPVEVQAVARAAGSEQDGAIFTVAAFTGLRLGELRELRWRDIDFAKQTVFVRGASRTASRVRRSRGRSGRSPLIDQAAVALDLLSRRGNFTSPDDLVFCTELGST